MSNELKLWTKKTEEISNQVWKISLTHVQGVIVEKTGTDLDQLETEVKLAAIEINQQIKKIKTSLVSL